MKNNRRFGLNGRICKIAFFIYFIGLLFPIIGMGETDISNSVVKVFCVQSVPFNAMPWIKFPVPNISGSGFIINGKRILTNAHVVSNQTVIQVQEYGGDKKYSASVYAISHEADIALLVVDDETFFENLTPLDIGRLPKLRDEVSVYGFPEGGDNLSITQGVVSRIEHHKYVHSSKYFLTTQIDAAINSGNSGGPVVSGGKVIGVATQTLQESENIGYIIPSTVIKHFL